MSMVGVSGFVGITVRGGGGVVCNLNSPGIDMSFALNLIIVKVFTRDVSWFQRTDRELMKFFMNLLLNYFCTRQMRASGMSSWW